MLISHEAYISRQRRYNDLRPYSSSSFYQLLQDSSTIKTQISLTAACFIVVFYIKSHD